MYSGGPEVVFLDKIDTEKEEKMDIDEPPLKIVVNNDGQPERNEPGNLRMRMHADAIEDDDSESDEDDDRREKRDKWKGRIEKKENKMEVRTEKPTLDLRSKLQSRQRHGFNFKNRPSLSIEIKEEPEQTCLEEKKFKLIFFSFQHLNHVATVQNVNYFTTEMCERAWFLNHFADKYYTANLGTDVELYL